jgi:DNA-binding transcriptional MocR family regulator
VSSWVARRNIIDVSIIEQTSLFVTISLHVRPYRDILRAAMSYKVDLSDLALTGGGSITQSLVDRLIEAIKAGDLAPGEQLPTTRALAQAAGINPMTAARIYRRLAELGYVEATVGRGTFVRALRPFASHELDQDWQAVTLPSPRPVSRERLLQEAMCLSRDPAVISLGAGVPEPATLPHAQIAAASRAAFAEEGPAALAYSDVEGLPILREQLALLGVGQGFASDGCEILVTSGARQALDLVARTVLAPGDVACVESPSFIGTLTSLEGTGARVIGIPTDADGLDVDALERVLHRHPVKLVALQPVCQNPTGRHLSAARRQRLLSLARERSFFVLEDGVYGRLPFARGEAPPSLRGEAPCHVIYVDSVSKTIGGGLRIGWIAAEGPVFNRLVALKMMSDLHTSTLDQHVVARYLASGHYDQLLAGQRALNRVRATALTAALERHLPDEYQLFEPLGGHSVWLTFRRRIDEQALHAEALRQGVTVTPGRAALVEPSQQTSLRLSFSLADEEQIDEGVDRLATAFRAVLRAERFGTTVAVN